MNVHASRALGAAAGADAPVKREIVIATEDGFPLAGTLFDGAGNGPLLLISSATAVPRGFYASFAAAAVQAGARAALIYDYRGSGGSVRPTGWRKRIGMKDWAVLDLPAAARALDMVQPGHEMVGLGQSFGGQALGLCGISGRFARYGMVATLSGYFGGLDDRGARWKMLGVGVPTSYLFRDIPKSLGIGDPIPSTVFRDWARWCSRPDYFFGDPMVPETSRFAEVTTPILALGMTDDAWGTPRAIKGLVRHYANAPVEIRHVSPQDAGAPIGHLGYFRSRFATTLWPDLIGWLLHGTPARLGQPD